MTYFPDTNICIFYLNGSNQNVCNALENVPMSDIMIPSMVAAELIYGAEKSAKREHNLSKVKAFLSLFSSADFNDKASEIYGAIRSNLEHKGSMIGGNDLIIAATVLAYGGILVTNNTGEFTRVSGLSVVDWV